MTADWVLAGTGSRSLRTAPLAVQREVFDRCEELVARRIVEHGSSLIVLSGGAEGFDECLARAAIRRQARLWLACLPAPTSATTGPANRL